MASQVSTERIKDVIGPGGKNIRKIIEMTQTTIDIQDDGSIHIGSPDGERTEQAIKMIRDLTQEAEVDRCIKDAIEFLGALDILVNNTGTMVERRLFDQGHASNAETLRSLLKCQVLSMLPLIGQLPQFSNSNFRQIGGKGAWPVAPG